MSAANVIGNDNLFANLQAEAEAIEAEAPPKRKPGRPKGSGVKVKKSANVDKDVKEDLEELLNPPEKAAKTSKKKTKKVEELDADAEKEAQKKQSLLLVLHHYAENKRFAEYLKQVAPKELYSKNLSKKSIEELEEIVVRVRFCVNNKNGGPISDAAIKGVFAYAEMAATRVSRGRVLLQGTTEQLWADEEFLDLLEQLKLEYLNFAKLDPKLQISLIIARTAFAVNGINQHNREMKRREQEVAAVGRPNYEAPPPATSIPSQTQPVQEQVAPVQLPPIPPYIPNLPMIPPIIAPPTDKDPIEMLLGKK